MKDSPPRQRRHRRREHNGQNGPWTVKNTFLEVKVDFDDDDCTCPLSPAVSSPGKMETRDKSGKPFSPNSSIMIGTDRSKLGNILEGEDPIDQIEDELTADTEDALTPWNPYVAPFEPVKRNMAQMSPSRMLMNPDIGVNTPSSPGRIPMSSTQNPADHHLLHQNSNQTMQTPPPSQDWGLEPGRNVVLTNLVANGAPFNGFWGRIETIDPDTMRYHILLDDFYPSITVKVKECNLHIPRR